MSSVLTAFVNHTDSASFHKSVTRYLYHNDLAAIHYNDTPISAHPDEIKKLNKLKDYLTQGAILGVRYHKAPELKGGLKVGHVGPAVEDADALDATIHIIICRGKGSEIHPEDIDPENRVVGHIEAELGEREADIQSRCEGHLLEEFKTLASGGEGSDGLKALKAIQIKNPQWVWYRHYPMFGSIRHQQATARWKDGNQQLIAAYLGVTNLGDVRSYPEFTERLWDNAKNKIENAEEIELLSDGQLEILCDEYLRNGLDKHIDQEDAKESAYQDYFHLQPMGGSQIAVDIIARDAGTETPILSQITFRNGSTSKVDDLRTYAEESNRDGFDLWYFGSHARTDEELQTSNERPTVRRRSIEETYQLMSQYRPSVINELLSVPDPSETGEPQLKAETTL
nr:hypothetical protein [Haloarcula taiwanensis]